MPDPADIPIPFHDATINANRLAESCSFELLPERLSTPPARVPAGLTPQMYLEELCYQALAETYQGDTLLSAKLRLEHELVTLRALGLASVFLLAREIVQFCESLGIALPQETQDMQEWAMAYSMDLRERVVKAHEAGQHKNAIAKRYEISWWTVDSYIKRAKAGKLKADSPPGRAPRLDAEGCKVLAKQVDEHADWTLEEHSEALRQSSGLQLKKSAMSKYLQKMNLRYKKKSLPK